MFPALAGGFFTASAIWEALACSKITQTLSLSASVPSTIKPR